MNTYVIIGAPGQGKSPWIRNFIQGNKVFVFDIQNEYGQRTKYPGQTPVNLSNNINDPRSRYVANNVDEFILLCQRKRNTICVFEEATAFFEGKTMKHTRKHLIDRYHTGNVSIFVFHSINSVPPRIFELCNFVILFKTLDQENRVSAKFSRLLESFKKLSVLPDGSHVTIKMI